jgi:hypothetical protein
MKPRNFPGNKERRRLRAQGRDPWRLGPKDARIRLGSTKRNNA